MEEDFSVEPMHSFFRGIPSEKRKGLIACLEGKTALYTKGEFILTAGQKVDRLGVVLSGEINLIREDFWGNRNLIAQLGPGAVFAEAYACVPNSVLAVSAVALKPATILWLKAERLVSPCEKACPAHQQIAKNLLMEMAKKNLGLNEKLAHMERRTTREKLLSYLSAQARRFGASVFDIPLNRQQLADYLSVERSAMSAELGKLRDEGKLRFKRNHFELL